jgi:hypothetical protein
LKKRKWLRLTGKQAYLATDSLLPTKRFLPWY